MREKFNAFANRLKHRESSVSSAPPDEGRRTRFSVGGSAGGSEAGVEEEEEEEAEDQSHFRERDSSSVHNEPRKLSRGLRVKTG